MGLQNQTSGIYNRLIELIMPSDFSPAYILFCDSQVYKLYKDPWGEKIFSNEHGTGPHALSVAGATGNGNSLFTNSTNLLASTCDDDKTRALAHKLRLVEIELEKYKVSVRLDLELWSGFHTGLFVGGGGAREILSHTLYIYHRQSDKASFSAISVL